ncbi:aspartate aminotransferase [Yamadazyma tenuis]|uniref:Aspartate aminotransferase n=1 Tax=Candida tenuis (strain ATCC 10573 / BCRC 21748 / CBS 615 / JCM 9827 / NBRC 10315 / NRRL Y-1498 / VKM Y-70) TaxID=590646 RepID=G3B0T3_CANTC|nr:aspartate aminotransferase/Glutamic oxaloacetic transaminase AAT2/GOT1 [Yamadazyma tenuis ATCC 10573]EGV64796.1 aspartate aminotransferase/Glutamic oxaloacetic transaminase AAT2/GOT1 [Yamadazyma tenuis ATCC 10573]WEJ97592.1 aspartate aminotransferase [Yamadazyma tenuis]
MSKFSHLELQPADEFNDLRIKLANDSDPNKIDVSAGVYRGEDGDSFTLPVVRKAKHLYHEENYGHDYTFCLGLPEFVQNAAKVAVGETAVSKKLVASCQTIGGTGACHLGALFLSQSSGYKNFYLGIPAWPNYFPLIKQAGGTVTTYSYYDTDNKCVDFDAMVTQLNTAPAKSVFILQLCCHNPTAADLTIEQWSQVAEIMKKRDLIPFFDAAYQGFASGSTETDGLPIQKFIELGCEVIVCQSFSKNLGLYGERLGCLHVVVSDASNTPLVSDQLRYLFRAECSSSPAYGARLMALITKSDELFAQWKKDLQDVSVRLRTIRDTVYKLITEKYKTPGTWEHVKTQRGLFWYSGLTEAQSKKLLEEYHVFLPKNGRVNVAGLNDNNIDAFCAAFDAVVRN